MAALLAALGLEPVAHRSCEQRVGGARLLDRVRIEISLLDTMRREIARSRDLRTEIALLWVDLDGFKGINDQLGHQVGDDVLRQVVERLFGQVRPGDHVGSARWGTSSGAAV